ncbi:MAG: ABC transporter ATP-binding protein [Patulibacter sp.]
MTIVDRHPPSGTPATGGPHGAAAGSLDASGLVVRFEGIVAIDGIDCAFEPATIVGLIGPNGAGKTTLVNVLTGFQRPTEGTVRLDGVEITRQSPERRARAGVVRTFQGARLFSDLDVIENVEVSGVGVGLGRRAARARAVEALDALGIGHLGRRRAADLSTGQERRLQVARALAMRPRFLFLDEPAAGLNEHETDELVAAITALPSTIGCGVVLIEHDVQMVMSLCARLVVLDQGAVLAVGTPAEIRADQRVVDAYLGS